MEQEIEELIQKNYLAVKTLSSIIPKVEEKATHNLLLLVRDLIKKELTKGWQIHIDDDLSISWTGLKITREEWNGIEVKLEGYSKMPWGNNYYGIVANSTNYERSIVLERLSKVEVLKSGFRASKYWPYYKYILDLSTDDKRSVLFNENTRPAVALEIATKIIELAKACEEPLAGIHRLGD